MKNYRERMRIARIIARNVRIFEDTKFHRELMVGDEEWLRHFLTHRALRHRGIYTGENF